MILFNFFNEQNCENQLFISDDFINLLVDKIVEISFYMELCFMMCIVCIFASIVHILLIWLRDSFLAEILS